MKWLLTGLMLTFCSLFACKNDDDVPDGPPDTTLDLSSQFYTDANGQPAGGTGLIREDFAYETWESWVKELFAPLDTATLPAGTASANDIERVSLFPNPGDTTRAMYVLGIDTVNVKAVLVSKDRTVRFRNSLQLQSSSNSSFFTMRFPKSALGTDSLFRLYYAFSKQGSPYFHTSHADITIRR